MIFLTDTKCKIRFIYVGFKLCLTGLLHTTKLEHQNYVLLAIHHDVSNPYKEKQNNNCTNDVREPEKNNPIKQKFCHQFPFYRETFGQRPILTRKYCSLLEFGTFRLKATLSKWSLLIQNCGWLKVCLFSYRKYYPISIRINCIQKIADGKLSLDLASPSAYKVLTG